MLSINDVLEILSTPLLGIIPENQGVLRASNVGSPVTLSEPTNAAACAYMDAAKRLEGEDLPVVLPFQRQGFLDRLFGRRAA
jgi:septum site-determining protein MinD